MNLTNFINIVKLANSPIVVKQKGSDGFVITTTSQQSSFEEEQTIVECDRIFKSLSTIPDTLREHGIFSFSVQIDSAEIVRSTRTRKTEEEKKAIEQQKAMERIANLQKKLEEAKKAVPQNSHQKK